MTNDSSPCQPPAAGSESESRLNVKLPLATTFLLVGSLAAFPLLLVTFAAMTGFCLMWIVTGLNGHRKLSAYSLIAALGTYWFFSTTHWGFSSPAGELRVTWHGVLTGAGSTLALIWHPCFERHHPTQ